MLPSRVASKIIIVLCLLLTFNVSALAGGEKAIMAALKWLSTVGAGVATQVLSDEIKQHRHQSNAKVKPAASQVKLRWIDHALDYYGILTLTDHGATISANVFDLQTHAPLAGIRNQNVGINVVNHGFSVSGIVSIEGDSTTPYQHQHQFNLVFTGDSGVPSFRNCVGTLCYPGQFL